MRLVTPDPGDPRRGLALLPPPSPGDLYFDMEGYPHAPGGLEYLFGFVEVQDARPAFHDLWAFDEATEREAFERFVDLVIERWRGDGSMHVYHYAPYEPSALKRLMGKHGTREDEVDHLLRHHVFVDLYRVVRQGVRVGTRSASLKDVEHLYMDREGGDVATAGESIVQFARWTESGEPRAWKSSPLLRSIRHYNEEDCLSTYRLASWLRERQRESGIGWIGPEETKSDAEGDDDPLSLRPEIRARRELAERLLERAKEEDAEDGVVSTTLAHLLEFHRREEKPLWWSFFERHEMTPREHVEDLTCLGDARRTAEPPFPIKRSLGFAYTFDPAQDTKIQEGDKVILAGHMQGSLSVEALDAEAGRLVVKAGRSFLAAFGGTDLPPRASFLLHSLVDAGTIAGAIEEVARAWDASRRLPPSLSNLLRRAPPPLRGHEGGPLLRPDEDVLEGTLRVVRALRGGTLAVQGPPGSGKTYVAAGVIRALLDEGRNVGVVSNSHEAVLNLFEAVRVGSEGDVPCLKVGGPGDHPFFARCPSAVHARDGGAGATRYAGGLVGGTAWLFARDDMGGRLDFLFVDEAGQISLANLVGVSRSATNLVLLGDQMQLAQPVLGTHPGESGKSALDFLLGEHATVPPETGVFLPRTWRLHPKICAFVSEAVYEGRLLPEAGTVNRVVRLPASGGRLVRVEAGLVFSPVPHEGNTQASDEEVARVVDITEEILGRARTDRDGRDAGSLGIEHVLYVTPYNLQARRLRQALPRGARVASVDRFQGQEAPVVIVSLCTSVGESGSRGLAFVLDRNRLNVAVSRAQSLAIVVADPRLVLSRAATVADMKRLDLLAHVVEVGTH